MYLVDEALALQTPDYKAAEQGESMSDLCTIKRMEQTDSIHNYMPCGMAQLRSQGNFEILSANDELFKMLGYDADAYFAEFGAELLGRAREAAQAIELIRMHLIAKNYAPFHCMLTLNKRNQDELICLYASFRLYRSEDDIYVCVTLLDFSSYVASAALLNPNNPFAEIADNIIETSYFDYSIQDSVMHYSKTFSDRFNISPVMANYPASVLNLDIVAPDSVEAVQERFKGQGEGRYEQELHLILPDGEDVWYLYQYEIMCVEGKPMRAIGTMTDITVQYTKFLDASKKAQTDHLTGLYNKWATETLISETLTRRRQDDSKFALMIVDVDNFKCINDTFGHLCGDTVLAHISAELKAIFRKNDITGRIGGDEFLVLMKNYGSLDTVRAKAQSIVDKFNRVYAREDRSVPLSASVGIAIFDEKSKNYEELYNNADIALYRSKNQGKNRYTFFAPNTTGICRTDARRFDVSEKEISDLSVPTDF